MCALSATICTEWGNISPSCSKQLTQLFVNLHTSQIIKIADHRNGLVLLDDLKHIGVSRSALHRLVKNEVLRPVHAGTVFALGGAYLDIESEIAAACFAVPDSWVSGNTAAQYWEIRRIPRGRVELSVNSTKNPRLAGVRVRRTNVLEPDIVQLVNGSRVSSPRQTLFEIALEVDDRTLLSAYEDCLNRNLVTVEQIREFGSRTVKMGRHGSARFRRVILGRPDDLPIAMSHPELELARALEDLDPLWIRQYPITTPGGFTIHVDIARPDIKLGVEVDGELHDTPIAIHRDKHRDLQVAQLDWLIVRPTVNDVEKNLKATVALIRKIAQARARSD